MSNQRISRRRFVAGALASAVAGPTILTHAAHASRRSANDRINLGVIGAGMRGRELMRGFVRKDGVQIVAISEIETQRRETERHFVEAAYAERSGKGTYKGCQAYGDFLDLLARTDLDAVVVATPDHWHAIPAVMAAESGRDIYCEKPLALTIGQGRAMVRAAAENNIVFQTGSQQRSEYGGKFRYACELVRNGYIGELKTIRIGVGAPPVPCDLPGELPPPGTDWERWLGPAALRGYSEVLCPKGIHTHYPAFRKYREYAGGGLADMGAHHFDIAQWALDMDTSGPVSIEPPEGEATTGLKFTYANGVVMYHGGKSGCTFEGSEGTIYVDRGKLESTPEEIVRQRIGPGEVHLPVTGDHGQNWIDCMRSRTQPICPAEVGHRSATVCHLANLGYQLRRPLRWDPDRERFLDDDEANGLIHRAMRSPWTL
jgi:predicted dehydrogenase